MSYQIYRNTTIGQYLDEVLDELVQCGQIPVSLRVKVNQQFDKCVNVALANRVRSRISFKAGHLDAYRFCDNVWTFVLSNVEFREIIDLYKIDKVKIVACDGKANSAKGSNNSSANIFE